MAVQFLTIQFLTIKGLRGFAEAETLELAQPDGTAAGSGLTVLVGPNNGGKSTIVEAFRALASNQNPSFTEGKRNKAAGDRVDLTLKLSDEVEFTLKTKAAGGSETDRVPSRQQPNPKPKIYVVPSRRYFNPYFGKGVQNRDQYQGQGLPVFRGEPSNTFTYRLFQIIDKPNRLVDFNKVLGHVMHPCPDWTIDQADSGQHYLKIKSGAAFHNSDGLGEGIVSLFFLVDALYDSSPGDVIIIDEPELSLHPIYQRRLAELLSEYAKNRQIVYATHSPYFLPLNKVDTGLEISRIYKDDAGACRIVQLSQESKNALSSFAGDINNPHMVGLDAREAFFLEDRVLLVEGQEDVVCYNKILNELKVEMQCEFFGWGVGGANKMRVMAKILHDLGYQKVVGILDHDQEILVEKLMGDFPGYQFVAIPMDDVRTKVAQKKKSAKKGLLDQEGKLRTDIRERVEEIFNGINEYMGNTSG